MGKRKKKGLDLEALLRSVGDMRVMADFIIEDFHQFGFRAWISRFSAVQARPGADPEIEIHVSYGGMVEGNVVSVSWLMEHEAPMAEMIKGKLQMPDYGITNAECMDQQIMAIVDHFEHNYGMHPTPWLGGVLVITEDKIRY